MRSQSHKSKLNSNQIHILQIIYKFRFINSALLAKYYHKHRSVINRSLEVLKTLGCIDHRYGKDFRILGKGATYYLTIKGINFIKDTAAYNTLALHAMYKNGTVGQKFIDECIDSLRVYLTLRESYPNEFHLFTKTDSADFDYFPNPRPELYLNRINSKPDASSEFLLIIFSETNMPFVMKKKVKQLLEHYDDGEWESATSNAYPTILLVFPSSRLESVLQTEIIKLLDNAGIDELTILTTTSRALLGSDLNNRTIWTNLLSPSLLMSL